MTCLSLSSPVTLWGGRAATRPQDRWLRSLARGRSQSLLHAAERKRIKRREKTKPTHQTGYIHCIIFVGLSRVEPAPGIHSAMGFVEKCSNLSGPAAGRNGHSLAECGQAGKTRKNKVICASRAQMKQHQRRLLRHLAAGCTSTRASAACKASHAQALACSSPFSRTVVKLPAPTWIERSSTHYAVESHLYQINRRCVSSKSSIPNGVMGGVCISAITVKFSSGSGKQLNCAACFATAWHMDVVEAERRTFLFMRNYDMKRFL